MRKVLYVSLVAAILIFWVVDRASLSRKLQAHEKQALEYHSVCQRAIEERDRSCLIASFADVAFKHPKTVDMEVPLMVAATAQLVRLWRYESEIENGKCERVTVSALRLLRSLNCSSLGDYFDLAERVSKSHFANGDFDRTKFLDMREANYLRFCEFLERAFNDEVASDDGIVAMLENAPSNHDRGEPTTAPKRRSEEETSRN